MGYRQAAVLSAVGFLLGRTVFALTKTRQLKPSYYTNCFCSSPSISFCFSRFAWVRWHTGVLFISFNADYRVLWQPLTDKAIDDAFYYYTTFYNAPKVVQVSDESGPRP